VDRFFVSRHTIAIQLQHGQYHHNIRVVITALSAGHSTSNAFRGKSSTPIIQPSNTIAVFPLKLALHRGNTVLGCVTFLFLIDEITPL
jgi:hypothetical protein